MISPEAENRMLEMEAAKAKPEVREVCTLCKEKFTTTGQQTGPIWVIWGPHFQICKFCYDASKTARLQRRQQEIKWERGECFACEGTGNGEIHSVSGDCSACNGNSGKF